MLLKAKDRPKTLHELKKLLWLFKSYKTFRLSLLFSNYNITKLANKNSLGHNLTLYRSPNNRLNNNGKMKRNPLDNIKGLSRRKFDMKNLLRWKRKKE